MGMVWSPGNRRSHEFYPNWLLNWRVVDRSSMSKLWKKYTSKVLVCINPEFFINWHSLKNSVFVPIPGYSGLRNEKLRCGIASSFDISHSIIILKTAPTIVTKKCTTHLMKRGLDSLMVVTWLIIFNNKRYCKDCDCWIHLRSQ